jgi:hypothetical protein
MWIILKYALKGIGRDRENESLYISINRSNRLFCTQKLTFVSTKEEISLLAEGCLVSLEARCCMEVISYLASQSVS